MQIYSLHPKDLESIAKEFYKDKEKNIHLDISHNDPLYWVSGVRGFFELGNIKMHDTNTRLPGLRELFDKIPDTIVEQLQRLAIDYTIASKNGGLEQVLRDLVGIELDFVDDFKRYHYITKQQEISEMISNVNELLPRLLEIVQIITSNADLIFDQLLTAKYINKEQKEELASVIQDFEADLLEIEKNINRISSSRDALYGAIPSTALGALGGMLGADLGAYMKIEKIAKSLKDYLEVFEKDEYVDLAKEIATSHKIPEMLASFSTEHKRYLNGDLLYGAASGGKTIWVNISVALQMYSRGKRVLEEKQLAIHRLTQTLDQEIHDFYEQRKRATIRQIERIEQNPNAYQHLLYHYGFYPGKNRRITRLRADDHIHSLRHVDMDYEIRQLQESVDRGYRFIKQNRTAIEALFDKEMEIAQRFDLMEGLYNGS